MKNIIIGICVLLSLLCIIGDAARAATTEEIVPGYSQAPIEGNSGLSVSLYKRAWVSGSYKLTSEAYGGCNADPLKRNTTQSIVAYMSASADRSTWPIVSKSYIETNPSSSNLPDGHVRARRMRDPNSPKGQDWYYYFAKKTVGKSQVVYKAHTILWHITGFLGPITPRWLGGKNTKRTFRESTDTMQAVWTASSRSGLDTSVVPYAYGKITSYSSNTNGGTGIMIAQVEADTTKNPDGTDNQYDSLSTNFRQAETVGTGKPIVVCPACEEVVTTERQHLMTCKSHSYQRFAKGHVYVGMANSQVCGKTYWYCVGEGHRAHGLKANCPEPNCGLRDYRCGPPHTCEGISDQEKYGGRSGNNGGNSGNGGSSNGGSSNGGSSNGGSSNRVRCGNRWTGSSACTSGGYASSRTAHQSTCARGHTYWSCNPSALSYHSRCTAPSRSSSSSSGSSSSGSSSGSSTSSSSSSSSSSASSRSTSRNDWRTRSRTCRRCGTSFTYYTQGSCSAWGRTYSSHWGISD